MPEPLPITTILADLDTQWNGSNVTEPAFIEVNAANEPIRFDLNVGDQVIGRAGSPAFDEEPIGNWKYGNRTYNIELELFTNISRQRLYDIMAEIRRLCHARMHSLTNFQRQEFMSFSEETSEQINIWTGTIDIQLVNNAVLLET
tara:strand:- start:96 stop:530 length:435 start_codon:yes stop_codon:yes gene_type:complete